MDAGKALLVGPAPEHMPITNNQTIIPEVERPRTDGSAEDLERFVNKGASSFFIDGAHEPRDFYFLMLPKMTMLAFSAAVEPLRIANQLTGKCLYRWYLLSENGDPVQCSNGISIIVDGELTETQPGDTVFICSGVDGYLAASSSTVSWLRDEARHGRTLGGICTGAFTLARAGLLQDRHFTLHWENQPAFEELFPNLPFTNQIYCRDGQIMTCGGGDAAIDLLVSLIEEHYGTGLATRVAEMCLHGMPRRENNQQRLSIAAELGIRNSLLTTILDDMRKSFADNVNVERIAAKHSLSRRQLERLFQSQLNTSPAAKLREIRIERAHSLLSETNMPMIEVAAACGFQSEAAFRAAYKKRFGIVPSARKLRAGKSSRSRGRGNSIRAQNDAT